MSKTEKDLEYTNAKHPLDAAIETFPVRHLETDEELVVDARTYDPEIHEKIEPKVKKPKAEKPAAPAAKKPAAKKAAKKSKEPAAPAADSDSGK